MSEKNNALSKRARLLMNFNALILFLEQAMKKIRMEIIYLIQKKKNPSELTDDII